MKIPQADEMVTLAIGLGTAIAYFHYIIYIPNDKPFIGCNDASALPPSIAVQGEDGLDDVWYDTHFAARTLGCS